LWGYNYGVRDLEGPQNEIFQIGKLFGQFPTGAVYAEPGPIDKNILWIKASSYASNLAKLRSDDDDSDISYADIGHHFVDCIRLFETFHTVELVKAFEVKVTQESKDERCIGMIAIRLHSPQGLSEIEQMKKLKHLAQTAIYTEAFRDVLPTDLPQYVLAFRYEISPVNYPQFIILGLLQGFDAQWYDRHDNIGMSWLMDDIYSNFVPDACGRPLPPSLSNWIDRNERLGLVMYTSKMDSSEKAYGRNIAIAYAPTVKGYQAAADFINQFRNRIIQLYSGLSVTIECFPPRDNSKGGRKKNDNI
jgi:hypothetical protein